MGLLVNGINQFFRIYSAAMGNPELWHGGKIHTVAVVFKANLAATTEQAIVAGCNAGTSWRWSGPVFRGNQNPKYVTKKKSSGDFYYPNVSTGFVPTSDWNVFIFSRSAVTTGTATSPARARLNGGAANTTATQENSLTDLAAFFGGTVRNGDGTFSNYFEGEYAVVAQWDRVLSSTEEDELFAFTRPEDVSGGAPNFLVEFSGSGTAANFTTPTGHIINFTGSPTLTPDTPYSAPTISSVNGGAGIRAGSTGNTAQTTSYANNITSGSYGGKTITVTDYNPTTRIVTFDVPAYSDGETYPNPLNAHTLTLTSSNETASIADQQMLLPVDHGSSVAAALVTDNERYLAYWDTEADDGDYWIFPQETVPVEYDPTQPENFEIYANGEPRASTTGARTIWRYDVSTSSFVRIDAVVTDASTAGAGSIGGGIAMRGIAMRGIAMRGM